MGVGAPAHGDDNGQGTDAVDHDPDAACLPQETRDEKVEAARRLLREAISGPSPVAVRIRTRRRDPDRTG
ncbi:MAG: hypothetical protein M3N68_13640 [Actinomycetota bacterium]|nr:hypothetical protein [Actinomycetota bacterium]